MIEPITAESMALKALADGEREHPEPEELLWELPDQADGLLPNAINSKLTL
jgi:hypothetical protein